MSKLEPCLGERRRPRLDQQGHLSLPKGMDSTVEVQGKPDKMRTAASADASTGFAGAAKLCLQILGKHLASLRHSKTCRCQFGTSASPVPSATAPTWQKALGPAVGLGMSHWQDSTEGSHAGGDYSSLMKSGKGLSGSALFLPVGKRDWRDLL